VDRGKSGKPSTTNRHIGKLFIALVFGIEFTIFHFYLCSLVADDLTILVPLIVLGIGVLACATYFVVSSELKKCPYCHHSFLGEKKLTEHLFDCKLKHRRRAAKVS
jgi:hypothetical protein